MYRLLLLIPILLSVLACAVLPTPPPPTPTMTPWPTPTPYPTITPHPTLWPSPAPLPPDTGWQLLQPGIELRQIRVRFGENPEQITIVRLDPSHVRFEVHYDPIHPRTVYAWAQDLNAQIVINGAYFTPENKTVGLLVTDGRQWGASYGDFAGMFSVDASGSVSIRWLQERPYSPLEPLQHALQSFPVLVKPGGVMGFPADADDGRPARRSVVAQDTRGHILIIVAPDGTLSLHHTARFLAESDLEINVALNLDGGTSTGLWFSVGTTALRIDSLVPVPSIIVVSH
ncbi:MAG: phosphodiester glycosidase family protein [Chloroflexi bacterium]|nr:phosphodiester glycosidase family protein [Chloroflexota bacterium]